MRILFDTNIYVYMVSDMESLTKDVRAVLEDVEVLKYLSIVSLQELIIAFRSKSLLSNFWKNELEMIEFILHDPSVAIDNIDEHVIRTLVTVKKQLGMIEKYRPHPLPLPLEGRGGLPPEDKPHGTPLLNPDLTGRGWGWGLYI